jgi:hypothetical protein
MMAKTFNIPDTMKRIILFTRHMILRAFILVSVILLQFSCGKDDVNANDPNIPTTGSDTTKNPGPDTTTVSNKYSYLDAAGFTLALEEGIGQTNATVILIRGELSTLPGAIPSPVLQKMQEDTIFIVKAENNSYHDLNSGNSLAGSVVIGNLSQYSTDRQARLFLFGLLSKLYFDKTLTPAQKSEANGIFNSARSKYAKVYRFNGTKLEKTKVQAPASVNLSEYLSELSKAYVDTNYYYPFIHEELERFDPQGFAFIAATWGSRSVAPNEFGITLPPPGYIQGVEVSDDGKTVASKVVPIDLWYSKYLVAESAVPGNEGIPIVASRFVSDAAIVQCKYIVETMLSKVPEALEYMLAHNYRVGLIGAYENVTDLPENRAMPVWWPDTDWDARGRGYGATNWLPLMSCGEENIIKMPAPYRERYPTESIMVHEFAHNVDAGLRGAIAGFEATLTAAFNHAIDNKLWYDTYSASNSAEYWAEGVQAWFNTCRMSVYPAGQTSGTRFTLKTREQLKNYDPTLHDLIAIYLPEVTLTGYHFDYE